MKHVVNGVEESVEINLLKCSASALRLLVKMRLQLRLANYETAMICAYTLEMPSYFCIQCLQYIFTLRCSADVTEDMFPP